MKFINNALVLFIAKSATAKEGRDLQIENIFDSVNASAVGGLADSLGGAVSGLNATSLEGIPTDAFNMTDAFAGVAEELESALGGLMEGANATALQGLDLNSTDGLSQEQLESIFGGNITDVLGGLAPEGIPEGGGFTDFFGTMPTDMMMDMGCGETCPAELCATNNIDSDAIPDEQVVSDACDAGTLKDCYMGTDMICSLMCGEGGLDLAALSPELSSGVDESGVESLCTMCTLLDCCDGTNTFADTCKTHFDAMVALAPTSGTSTTGATEAATDSGATGDEDMDEHDDHDGHDHDEDTDALEGDDAGDSATGVKVGFAVASIVSVGLVLTGM